MIFRRRRGKKHADAFLSDIDRRGSFHSMQSRPLSNNPAERIRAVGRVCAFDLLRQGLNVSNSPGLRFSGSRFSRVRLLMPTYHPTYVLEAVAKDAEDEVPVMAVLDDSNVAEQTRMSRATFLEPPSRARVACRRGSTQSNVYGVLLLPNCWYIILKLTI